MNPFICKAMIAGSRFNELLNILRSDIYIGQKATVHSVFHRVVNIEYNGELVSLVCEHLGNDRNYLVVKLPVNLNFFALGLEQGMEVAVVGNILKIDEVVFVDCDEVTIWQDRRPSGLTWKGDDLSDANVYAFQNALCCWGAKSGLVKLINGHDHPLTEKIRLLSKVVYENKKDGLHDVISGLLGYGPGLTPSGDDFLHGFIAVASTGSDYHDLIDELYRTINNNLKSTNEISSSFLRKAMAGCFHEYLQETIHAVTRGSIEDVITAVRALITLGATSGTDIAVGIYMGFYMQLIRHRFEGNNILDFNNGKGERVIDDCKNYSTNQCIL
jgi:hypothetical protein